MSALVLDAGAFVAVDRQNRSVVAQLRAAQLHGIELCTSAIVVAQVWRDPSGRQAELARLLRAVNILPVDERMGREAGVLIAKAGGDDPIDATVVLVAANGDRILTSDPRHLRRLAAAAGKQLAIIAC